MHISKDLLLVWLLVVRINILLEDLINVSFTVKLVLASFRTLTLVALFEEFQVFPLVSLWCVEF